MREPYCGTDGIGLIYQGVPENRRLLLAAESRMLGCNNNGMCFCRRSWKEVAIQPPKNLEEMIEEWLAYKGESVGYCFVCDSVISSESEIIPGTNDHRCKR